MALSGERVMAGGERMLLHVLVETRSIQSSKQHKTFKAKGVLYYRCAYTRTRTVTDCVVNSVAADSLVERHGVQFQSDDAAGHATLSSCRPHH